MPHLRVQNIGGSLKVLYVDNTDITLDRQATYLTEDIIATGTTFRVQSIFGFEQLSTSSGQIVVIGKIGDERTEILRTSNSTGPSSSYKEVSLRDALNFDHQQDTPVTIVDFNRIDFQYAASTTGTKTTIVAYPVAIAVDQRETVFRDTTEASNRLSGAPATVFYFARRNDSITDRNSDWSDPVYGAGYDDNMVAAIKSRAVKSLGEKIDDNLITNDFLNDSLWEARREYHDAPGKRPFRRNFNKAIGVALTGSYRIELPIDVERPWTAENIYGLRIGTSPRLEYVDKKTWDFDWQSIAHSTLDLPYTAGISTSIWLANGRDFSGSAVISAEGTNIGLTKIVGSNNSFYVVTHGAWNVSGGSDAYENATYGLPDKFTVFADPGGSAYIYFNRPIDTAYINQNISADYYRTLLGFDSDADVLDEPGYDMFQHYLMAKIKHRKMRGETDITQDSDYKVWLFKKSTELARETISTDIQVIPDIDPFPD